MLRLFVVISISGRTLTKDERKTFLLLCGAGFSIAFITNFLLFKIGAMTFLPWINNFLHSFFWIGLGFPWLYFATRGRSPLVVFITFTTLSLVVKYIEQLLFGTWTAPTSSTSSSETSATSSAGRWWTAVSPSSCPSD
jgi:hypothetical protein